MEKDGESEGEGERERERTEQGGKGVRGGRHLATPGG